MEDIISYTSCFITNLFIATWKQLLDREALLARQERTSRILQGRIDQMERDEEAKLRKEHAEMNAESDRARDAMQRKAAEYASEKNRIKMQLMEDEAMAKLEHEQAEAKARAESEARKADYSSGKSR